jgi:methyl-accepting chemotaxis protein
MTSLNQLSLKHRLTIVGILVALVPFPVLTLLLRGHLNATTPTPRSGMTASDLDHFAATAYRTAESFEQEITQSMLLAQGVLMGERGVKQSKSRRVTWEISGGDSNGGKALKLPLWWIRRTALRPSTASQRSLVDEVSTLSGAQCSIFQRINESGDMLLVSTSGGPSEGKRAVGTVTKSSGNPAIQAALGKRGYNGTSVVAGRPVLVACQPISRSGDAVIGMMSVSLPEAVEAEKIRRSLSNLRPGSRVRFFGLYAEGSSSGTVSFASGDAALSLSPSVSADMIRAALAQPGATLEQRYSLVTAGDMIAHIRYFAPWKWVVGVTVPQSEMALPPPPLEPRVVAVRTRLWITLLLSAIVAGAVWAWYSALLSSEILSFAARMKGKAEQLLGMNGRISAAAEEQLREAVQQDGLLERAAAAVSEVGRRAQAEGSRLCETLRSARACEEHAAKASGQLKAMQGAMAALSASDAQVSGLMKDIEDIALQSRILALNASIEAARAGQHGAAFSVVADEFGTLAQRCGQAAKTTTSLLTDSIKINDTGREHLEKLGLELNRVCANSRAAESSLQECLPALKQQEQAAGNTSAVLVRMQNLSPAKRRSENYSTEILGEATHLQAQANELAAVVRGQGKPRKANRQPARQSSDAKAPEGSRSALRAY